MTTTPMLNHDIAIDLQHERVQACTEAAGATMAFGVIDSMRRVVGARLISLGERLTGSNAVVTTAGLQ